MHFHNVKVFIFMFDFICAFSFLSMHLCKQVNHANDVRVIMIDLQ